MSDAFFRLLLENLGLSRNEWEERSRMDSFSSLRLPDSDPLFQKSVNLLRESLSRKEKIVVYGDYDVDGLTSTAILVRALRLLGGQVGFFIPSRFHEGYGLNEAYVKPFAEKGYSLLVTVDNGVSALEPVKKAKALGLKVLIIDHHDLPKELPASDAIFHPTLTRYDEAAPSAASLAYFVARALLGRDDPYLATLAGMAVFSDVMPLQGNNLVFARLARKYLNQYQFENLVQLLPSGPYSYEDFSFRLIPTLNSPGRVSPDPLATNDACRFLVGGYPKEKGALYASSLLRENAERKNLVQTLKPLEKRTLSTSHGIASYYPTNLGVGGLLAGRILREKDVPVLVVTDDYKDSALSTFSIRAPEGYSFTSFLSSHASLFLAAGGHPRACGGTIRKKDYFQFATLFLTEAEGQALSVRAPEEKRIGLILSDLTWENYKVLDSFAPFGEGFKAPSFLLTAEKESLRENEKRTQVYALGPEGSKLVYFGKDVDLASSFSCYDFVGSFSVNRFQGKETLQFVAEKAVGRE